MNDADRGRWAFLADPDDFGWAELVERGHAVWDGIKNSQAQRNLGRCRVGDGVLVYHTSSDAPSEERPGKALVGVARVVREAYPDPGAKERVVVDVEPVVKLGRPLELAELKADAVLAQMGFVRMPRVAVQPLTAEQWDRVLELSGTDPGTAVLEDPAEAGGP